MIDVLFRPRTALTPEPDALGGLAPVEIEVSNRGGGGEPRKRTQSGQNVLDTPHTHTGTRKASPKLTGQKFDCALHITTRGLERLRARNGICKPHLHQRINLFRIQLERPLSSSSISSSTPTAATIPVVRGPCLFPLVGRGDRFLTPRPLWCRRSPGAHLFRRFRQHVHRTAPTRR